jgi:hypothetical protein
VSETNLRAVLAADMELGAGNVLCGRDPVAVYVTSAAALCAGATRSPLRIATIPDDDIVLGPTGKVRKFLMREQLLTGTGVS